MRRNGIGARGGGVTRKWRIKDREKRRSAAARVKNNIVGCKVIRS